MKPYNIQSNSIYFAHEYGNIPCDKSVAEKARLFYEIVFYVRGDAEITIEGKRYIIKPGEIFFISPGHRYEIKANSPWERCLLRFSEEDIPGQLRRVLKNVFGCYSTKNTLVPILFTKLKDWLTHYSGGNISGLLGCKLHEILYFFCSECSSCEYFINNKKVFQIIDYIEKNISYNFTLDTLCADLGYSSSCLCSEFRQYMKTSIMTYVRIRKIAYAETLISQGQKKQDVYKQCGFDDYSTFYRTYKKVLGMLQFACPEVQAKSQ